MIAEKKPLKTNSEIEKYFSNLNKEIKMNYNVAEKARAKGLDLVNTVETPLALTMASKVIKLVATIYPQLDKKEVVDRIINLEKKYGALNNAVSFKIAEEVAKQKYCKFESQLQSIDAAIRVGFAYTTLGVVSSPIEGFTELKTGKTRDGKTYLKAYFSGPIRSAGTTAGCVVLILIDYLRQLFGYSKYDPTEEECKRITTELYDYHERITNLQYLPTEEEIMFIAKNLSIQVAGDPTEKREVSNYKDLERVETNFIRGGFCLILGEGIAQKAAKGLRILKDLKKQGFKIEDWEWLEDYVQLHKKRDLGKTEESPTYIKDLVAGRPVFGHPGKGFRFRYGRSRVSGFSAVSIHPATMTITNGFIATGTQLKIEKPTKGCVSTCCDSIDGPIVKFLDGSVKKLEDYETAKESYKKIKEIIYLGDLLFPLGDLINRNALLIKPGYVEEWWNLELLKKGGEVKDYYNVTLKEAIDFSEKFKIPLHPNYIYYWTQITYNQFSGFIDWFQHSRINQGKFLFPYNNPEKERFRIGKRALELLGIPHEVSIENVILDEINTQSLLINLGLELQNIKDLENLSINFNLKNKQNVLEIINKLSKYKIKDKAGEFIGARMGRPEKAKLRKLKGSPNVLFPVGSQGGRLRSVNEALKKGFVMSEFPMNYCEKCKKETIYNLCEDCGSKTTKKYFCKICNKEIFEKKCKIHNRGSNSKEIKLDINHYFEKARQKLNLLKTEIPPLIKGVRGTISKDHELENLIKGILRAKHNLCVNKDGTIRYDLTELPITQFKPKEIEVNLEKLKEMGYLKDYLGNNLINDNQILELKPHDIILPCNNESGEEKADKVFMDIANFIDDLLEKFYKLPKFFNIKKREELIGQLGVCIAPHNCAGVVCRIIGFSKVQGLFASPYMHAAVRRDCFSYHTYIPIKQRGRWKNIKIGELVEELNPKKIIDNYNTKEKIVKGFKTIGFDKKLKEVEINNFTKHIKMPMLEIKTALGKKIKVTKNHKFFVDRKKKRASDLKIGDKLPLPKKIDIKSKNLSEINLLKELKDENLMIRGIKKILKNLNISKRGKILSKLNISKKQFKNFDMRDSYPIRFVLELSKDLKEKIYKIGKIATKRDNVEVPIVIKLTKELLEIIGLYIAEGYSRSINGKKGLNQVYISSGDSKIRKFIKNTIKNSFGLCSSEGKTDRVTFSSKVLYLFFTKILEVGSAAENKRMSYLFLDLTLEKLACVLRGYFEGDNSAEKASKEVCCDSISEGLLSDLEFCLNRFGIFTKRYEYKKEPGPKVKDFYIRKKRPVPKFKITKLIIGSDFINNFMKIGFLSKRKKSILKDYLTKGHSRMKIFQDENFVYDAIVSIKEIEEEESYCLNVNTENHLVVANNIVNFNCDGDEISLMLLMDVLINFSRKFLPAHRGGTQDAPLVLNGRISAEEVDDQILDFELVNNYPLDLYEKAEKELHSGEVNIEMVKDRIWKNKDPFINIGFTHSTDNFNQGVCCSSYKILPTMQEKVKAQMELCEKLRSVNQGDVARLIIDRHFMKDLKGNLRRFSQQTFRCTGCNHIFRRPPLNRKCPICNGNIIFTISYGGIVKYLEPALALAKNYNVPEYIRQDLELTKKYIESIFGKDNEKQESMEKWF